MDLLCLLSFIYKTVTGLVEALVCSEIECADHDQILCDNLTVRRHMLPAVAQWSVRLQHFKLMFGCRAAVQGQATMPLLHPHSSGQKTVDLAHR